MNAQELFGNIAAQLGGRGVNTGSLFGKPALKVGRKSFACLDGDGMAFRLVSGSDIHTTAMAITGARLFDPSGKGAPFKDWVTVPLAASDHWPDYAEVAMSTA